MGLLRDLFNPDEMRGTVLDIAPAELRARGFRAVMLDLDGTVVPYRGHAPSESLRAWVSAAQAQDLRVCLVSNTRRLRRIRRVAEGLGVPFVARARKPSAWGYRAAARAIGVEPQHAVAIGDQVTRDIWGGRAAGMFTILVQPLSHDELVTTRLERVIERAILRRLGLAWTTPGAR